MTEPIKARARAVAKGITCVEIGGEPYAQIPFRLSSGDYAGQVYVWDAPLAVGPGLAAVVDQLLASGAVMPNDNLLDFHGVGRCDVTVTIDPTRRSVTLVEKHGISFDQKRKNALALQAKPTVVHQKGTWTDA